MPNGSKIAFWKGRYFFRDRDTSCGKGDTSSEIEILLVEREILLQRSRYFLRKVRYFFRNRDTSLEIEDTSCRDTFSCRGILQVCRGILQVCRGILQVCRGKLLSCCRSFPVCIIAAFVA